MQASCSTSTQPRKMVSELAPKFRHIFPYISFNHVQTLVFETILHTNKPVIVSAPTGSGKTGVFELAIVKAIQDQELVINTGAMKIIYLAPTKALCSERRDDWEKKFSPFGIQCLELTSDFDTATDFKNIRKSSILLATPEKWDSITRSWNGHKAFVQSIRLLLIDEIHLVNDGPRGATLEAVISRMKTIRSMIWPTEQDNLRFVGVSATVSNVEDIAQWFATPTSETQIYQVDPRERPVKLRTVVLGYSANANVNEFLFDNLLNRKLPEVIREYSGDKPTLIFCPTRKSAVGAATALLKEGKFDVCFSTEKRRLYLQLSAQIRDKTLQETTRFGIAFHHAGLSLHDRRLIESGFISGSVMILSSTSTLALGVNLPAHLVIIKNTSFFDQGIFKPYSVSSLVQMIGRAGRPQFDTEATAVIMTKSFTRDKIEEMLTGKLVVDSQLHKFLTEHLNSEIVLGTITDDSIARKWIDSTFLYVRLMKCPENYGLTKKSSSIMKENTIINWCKRSIELLLKHEMVKRGRQQQLESTESGRAMARHYICLDTMVKLVQLTGTESINDLLQMVSSCYEVVSDIQVRAEEKTTLMHLNNPSEEKHQLRFPVLDKNFSREKKAATLIQVVFGNLTMTDNNMQQESLRIIRNASRVMNCLKEVSLINPNLGYKALCSVLTLFQCFEAKLWENSIYVSKQLEKIGPILSHNLAMNNMTTFEALRKASPRNIEIFCNRLPPFGSNVQQTCYGLPIYDLKMYFRSTPCQKDKVQLLVEVILVNGQDIRHNSSLPKHHECTLIVGNVKHNKVLLKHQVADISLISRPDLTLCFGTDLETVDLPANHEDIEGHLLSEAFVGLNVHRVVKYVEPMDSFYDV